MFAPKLVRKRTMHASSGKACSPMLAVPPSLCLAGGGAYRMDRFCEPLPYKPGQTGLLSTEPVLLLMQPFVPAARPTFQPITVYAYCPMPVMLSPSSQVPCHAGHLPWPAVCSGGRCIWRLASWVSMRGGLPSLTCIFRARSLHSYIAKRVSGCPNPATP